MVVGSDDRDLVLVLRRRWGRLRCRNLRIETGRRRLPGCIRRLGRFRLEHFRTLARISELFRSIGSFFRGIRCRDQRRNHLDVAGWCGMDHPFIRNIEEPQRRCPLGELDPGRGRHGHDPDLRGRFRLESATLRYDPEPEWNLRQRFLRRRGGRFGNHLAHREGCASDGRASRGGGQGRARRVDLRRRTPRRRDSIVRRYGTGRCPALWIGRNASLGWCRESRHPHGRTSVGFRGLFDPAGGERVEADADVRVSLIPPSAPTLGVIRGEPGARRLVGFQPLRESCPLGHPDLGQEGCPQGLLNWIIQV